MADRDGLSVGALREAIVDVTEMGGAWGRNMHESKQVLLRLGDEVYPLTRISASFMEGCVVLILHGGEPGGAE